MNRQFAIMRRSAREGLEWIGLLWDSLIIVLVALNLALIVFDSLFAAEVFANLVGAVSPAFRHWYAETIHAHFFTIDLYFVAVFALDVLMGWSVAIWRRTYHRWFFYPFVHFYDVLGCIPLVGFRWLRVLRVIALMVRLQRIGVIDIRDWYVYSVFYKYYSILLEEISDRVVVNVLGGVQEEVRSGGGNLSRRIVTDIVQPRKETLVTAIQTRAGHAVGDVYTANREQIQNYVSSMVDRAVAGNTAVSNLERIPMLGRAVTHSIEWAIRDTVNNVLDELVEGLNSNEFDTMVQRLTESVFDMLLQEQNLNNDPDIDRVIVEVIDLLKEQVSVQRWKQEYA